MEVLKLQTKAKYIFRNRLWFGSPQREHCLHSTADCASAESAELITKQGNTNK